MRNRCLHATNELHTNGNACAVKPSSKDMPFPSPRCTTKVNGEEAVVCHEYAIKPRREAENLEPRRLLFRDKHCSFSVLFGLLIWATIGLVVYLQVQVSNTAQLEEMSAEHVTAESVLPDGCRGDYCLEEGGTEAFGTVLGAHNGVYAYSNCYAHSCVSFLNFEYPIPLPPGTHTVRDDPHATTRLMQTGMKWQCVEYARRYWMLRGTPVPAFFGSVDGAADIWYDLTFVTLLDNVTTAPLFKYANGAALGYGGSAPRTGDLVIYPRDNDGKFPYGHVAVIVGVELPEKQFNNNNNRKDGAQRQQVDEADSLEGRVYIAEQNWHSSPWPGPYHNYSRWLPLKVTTSPEGAPLEYTIHDDYHTIQGWIRYGDP